VFPLIITIGLLRYRLRSDKDSPRNAAFSLTTPLHRLSLCVAIGAAVLCLNWTQYNPEQTVYFVGEIEDIIEQDIPITRPEPPPPPPPPPPTRVLEVEDLEADTTTFIDNSVMDDEPVIAPPPVIAPAAAPAPEPMPLPPPPVVEDTKDYPALARENNIEGTVVISFTVEKDGTVTDIVPARKVAGGCTESALKAVRAINLEGQKFLPGRQGGQVVRVRYNLPVKFKLQ